MVAHLLRLKLTLLRNSVRRSPWQLVGLGIGVLYALGLVGLAIAGLLFLRGAGRRRWRRRSWCWAAPRRCWAGPLSRSLPRPPI